MKIRQLAIFVCWLAWIGPERAAAKLETPSSDTLLTRVIYMPYTIRSIVADGEGVIWAGTGRGLESWNPDLEKFVLVDPDFSSLPTIRNGQVVDVTETGVAESALFDPHSEWIGFLPKSGTLRASHVDRGDGIHWVCNGRQLFEFRLQARPERLKRDKPVRAVTIWKDQIWSSTYNRIDTNGHPFLELPRALDGNFAAHNDTLYGFGHGIHQFPAGPHCDPVTHSCPSVDVTLHEPPHFGISANDTLWVGAYNWFGHRTHSGTIEVELTGIEVLSIRAIGDEIWILDGRSGILIRSPLGKFKRLTGLPEDMQFYDALEWEGKVVLASNEGLIFYDRISQSHQILTSQQGLMSSIVCSLALDAQNALWFSTYAGLHRMTIPDVEPEIFFPEIEFNRTSIYASPDSTIHLWGAMDGVYKVLPADYPLPPAPAPLPSNPQTTIQDSMSELWMIWLALAASMGLTFFLWLRGRHTSQKVSENAVATASDLFMKELEINVLRRLPNASVEQLAEDLNISLRTLYRRLAENDAKPGEILKSIRIKRAQALLERGLSLDEVALRVGYSPTYLEKLLAAPQETSNAGASQ